MIKDDMTLPLGTDTTNIKATTAVFLSATDDQISPYTIGFVPWDLMNKCVLFGKCSRIFYNSVPNTYFISFVNPDTYYFNPVKGVPFVYTIRTAYGNKIIHANYSSNAWHADQMVGESSNTDLQILHAYNTDYFVQNNVDQNESLTSIEFDIKIYEVIGDGGWTGTALQSVYEHNYLHVNATIADIENIGIAFSITLTSHFGTYTYTITQDNWLNCDEHGIFVIEGDDYEYQGQTYKRRLYCACVHAALPSEQTITTTSPGYGALVATGYRSTPHAGSASWACGWGRCEYGQTAERGYTINPYNYQRQFPNQYGYDSFVSDDVFFFRQASIQWFNHLLHGGATYEDVVVMICTSRPVYKNNNAYYVAEFTDDYYITGKLIPYAQAREWQKNINGDSNVFNPADIPEPGPEPGDEPDAYGADSLPDLNFSAGAISDFVTMYCLTEQQVSAFGAYLWANIFSEQFVRSIGTILVNDFSINPADILNYIISLRKYPFDLYGKNGYDPIASGSLYFGRGVAGIPISGAFGKMQNLAGTFGGEYIEVPAKYNDFRDYEPFTRITVFVPFCGSIELTPSEVVGKRIFITYTVDYSTGNVQADVWINSDVAFIVGTVTGQIGATVQTTASNNMEVLQKVASTAANFVKVAASIATIAATGGAAAESAMAGEITSAEATAKELGALSSTVDVTTGALSNAPVVSSNPIHASSVGSGFASFATPRARLIVERRKYQVPSNYNHVYGKATNVTATLSELEGKGFTVCKNVDLSGIPATQDELSAIESLLQSGVYF